MAITKLRSKLLKTSKPQFVIAGEVQIHPSRISEYALGKKRIPSHHLYKLCEYFECDAEDLIGDTDEDDIIDYMDRTE